MNTVKVFAEGVAKQIHDYLPAEYGNVRCKIQENLKNNGVRLVGIEFHNPDTRSRVTWSLIMKISNREKKLELSCRILPTATSSMSAAAER